MEKVFITADAGILGGKPIIAGTRIAVSTILDLLAADMTLDEVAAEYPQLTKDQVRAAITFASQRIAKEEIIPIVEKNGNLIFSSL